MRRTTIAPSLTPELAAQIMAEPMAAARRYHTDTRFDADNCARVYGGTVSYSRATELYAVSLPRASA